MTRSDGKPWSRKDLANAIGASLRSIDAWERDESTPMEHWNSRLNDLFTSELPELSGTPTTTTTPPTTAGGPVDNDANPLARYTLAELLEEALTRVAGAEARGSGQRPTPQRPPEIVEWMTEDAPSAEDDDNGEAGQDQAQ